MTIENYFCSNESLENIRKYCFSTSQTDVFSVFINQETVSIPIEAAIAISSKITNSLANDTTLREMHFQIMNLGIKINDDIDSLSHSEILQ